MSFEIIRLAVCALLTAVSYFFSDTALLLFLLIPAYIIAGYDVIFGAVKGIIHFSPFDEKFLMTVATLGAFAIGEYREAVFVMLLYGIGELFGDRATDKSRDAVFSLMDLNRRSARVISDGDVFLKDPQDIKKGELLEVRAGESVTCDGIVKEGECDLDTSKLTGESAPRGVGVGDRVFAGSVALSGTIRVCAVCDYEDFTMSKMSRMIKEAAEKKAKTEKFITRFSRIYTPVVVCAAALYAFGMPLLFDIKLWDSISRALVFLVVSCPCALVVSVPLTFFCSIGGASRCGILIKSSDNIEKLAKCDCVTFDKTGTLTKGIFEVAAVHPSRESEETLARIASALEERSTHPIARSIVSAYPDHAGTEFKNVREYAGMGICGELSGKEYYVGNKKLMEKVGADFHDCHIPGSVIHISCGNEYLGHIILCDTEKSDVKPTIEKLNKLGIKKNVMLTGDVAGVGENLAMRLGRIEAQSELLPDGKAERIREYKKEHTVIFVGDGINDTPALFEADVGISMGALGSDAAIEASDVVITDDSLLKIPLAIKRARKTMRIVAENVAFPIFVKLLILVLAAFGLANMNYAVFADVGVLILATLNAIRAMAWKEKKRTP